MSTLLDQLSELASVDPNTAGKILASVVVVLGLAVLRLIALRLVARRTDDVRTRYTWRKAATYTSVFLSIFILGRIWFAGFQSLATYFGLLSAGIAIALKDPIVNLAAWAFILWRRPFVVGDRIEIGPNRGDVIDLRIFQFTLMEIGNWVDADQSTGRVIRIPNGKVFTETLANYSRGFQFLWDEVPVLVTFESDWQKAKEILHEIGRLNSEHLTKSAEEQVREASAKMMIFYNTLTPTVYTSVKDCGVMLTIRYLCEPRERRGVQQDIWEKILTEFARHDDIDFAYPTQRFYDNALEGKPGARAGIGPQSRDGRNRETPGAPESES
jgi:small-conductance mechanosensitive channel